MKKRTNKKLTLGQKAEKALKEAVQDVIQDHQKSGLPLVVWKNSKVIKIPANKLRKTGS
ncbi:MAG TPA: hypothetical protein VJB34_01505 [Bdellovibrionota bacterium]|nr:hypothetical protein [Bdellovibrionota bacterium]